MKRVKRATFFVLAVLAITSVCAVVMLPARGSARGVDLGRSLAGTAATAVQFISLNAVSCSSRNACTAIGSSTTSDGNEGPPVAEGWNGRAWSLQLLPAAGVLTQLTRLSCPSRRLCFAVGSTQSGAIVGVDNVSTPIVERWDGRSWTIQRTPTVSFGALQDILYIGERMHSRRHQHGRVWEAGRALEW